MGVVENEKKEIAIGGDFNAGTILDEGDVLGKMLREEFMDSTGVEMLVKEPTHQELRGGKHCKNRLIDHFYSNNKNKVKSVEAVNLSGSKHKLVVAEICRNMKYSGPKQKLVRVRKNYSAEGLLQQLAVRDLLA